MAWFGKEKIPPVKVDPALNDTGFADFDEDTHHCSCGFSTKNTKAMDAHLAKEHPDG